MKQGQSSTLADIPVDIFNPYNSVGLQIFSYTCNISELTSTTSKERMTTNILFFVGATPIN